MSGAVMTGREHTLDKRKVHHKWDKRIPPAIEIKSGDTVICETAEVTNNQITPGCPASAITTIDFSQLYPLAGPIFVEGADPGDILEIDILRLEPLKWGWTGIIPGLGLLSEDFTEPYIRHFDLTNRFTAALRDDLALSVFTN
jgi:acetamidase/formamidase